MVYKELKNAYGEVYFSAEYIEDVKAVLVKWIGVASTDELKAGMEVGLELLKMKNASRWIADSKLMEGGFDDANDWLEKDWTPRAAEAGLKTVAFVVSDDVFIEYSTNEYAERNPELGNTHFRTLEDAQKWISDK